MNVGGRREVDAMSTRRALLTAGLALMHCAFGSSVHAAGGPMDFVAALGNQVLAVIRDNSSIEQKRAYFRLVLQQDFDIPAIAAFVLGPFWRIATEGERLEIVQILDDYIVVTFGRRLYDYGGVGLRVTASRGSPSEPIVVVSEIARPGGAPIRLDWVLSTRTGVYRIVDLVLDGISMVATQRSEFAGIIQRAGGTVAGLILTLRQIVAGGIG